MLSVVTVIVIVPCIIPRELLVSSNKEVKEKGKRLLHSQTLHSELLETGKQHQPQNGVNQDRSVTPITKASPVSIPNLSYLIHTPRS